MKLRLHNPALFLAALVVAFLLWYSGPGQRRERISERRVVAPLTLAGIPPNLVITSDVPESVAVRLRGFLSPLLQSPQPLEVVLDLSDARPGARTFPIEESDFQLPPDVAVVGVDPPEIVLQLERLENKTVPVRPVVEGEPAPGYVVGEVRVAPQQLTVRGPGSLLDALEHVETTPVSVNGATDAVEAAVQPRLPHPQLRPLITLQPLVMVEILEESAQPAEGEEDD